MSHCGTDDLPESTLGEPEQRARTGAYWSDWAVTLKLPAVEPDLVPRSALTLTDLVHHDTGAIMAAATTLLPEKLGGIHNQDYRYRQPRDATP